MPDPNVPRPVFISYAHEDNESSDKSKRWLDRLKQFLEPLVAQEELTICSDQDIGLGDDWHDHIQGHLDGARAAVLLVSPAFLASEYVRSSELPVLLRNAKERGVKIIPIILRPCLFVESKFKYPNPQTGPEEFSLASLQAAGSPAKALSEMSEGDQDRALLKVAQTLARLAEPRAVPSRVSEDPPVLSHSQVASQKVEPPDFVDEKVGPAAIALLHARQDKTLTMREFMITLDRLFERATFRVEPSVGECPTQGWDLRLHSALQTHRLFEAYEPFVEGEAPKSLAKYRELTRAVSRYCERMAAYLFKPAVDVAGLGGLVGTNEFVDRVRDQKHWFEGGVDPTTCQKIDPYLKAAIRHMKALHDQFVTATEPDVVRTAPNPQ